MRDWALRVSIPEDEAACWVWLGYIRPNGYGSFKIERQNTYAHRYAFERFVGPVPEGLEIDHLCRNRACVNPSHMEAVTHAENMARAKEARTQCKHGHPFTPENTWMEKNGARHCRTCHRMTEAARKVRIAAAA